MYMGVFCTTLFTVSFNFFKHRVGGGIWTWGVEVKNSMWFLQKFLMQGSIQATIEQWGTSAI